MVVTIMMMIVVVVVVATPLIDARLDQRLDRVRRHGVLDVVLVVDDSVESRFQYSRLTP